MPHEPPTTDRPRYRAVCRRLPQGWAIDVRDVPGVRTEASRFDELEGAAREAIALRLGVPGDAFDVHIELLLPLP